MFRVDTDVPIPDSVTKTRVGRPLKWPLAQMEIGHSVFAPNVKKSTALASIKSFRRRYNLKWEFVICEVEGGVRVWRVA